MSKLLYLKNYNNYYNRLVKKEDTTGGYKSAVGAGNFLETSIGNFNINEGVTANHTVNLATFVPDYCVVTDDQGTVKSRWFVMQSTHTSGIQYQLQLRRDLAADYWSLIQSAPAYIEKGTPSIYTTGTTLNPLLFNNESLEVNQLKKAQTELKDTSGISWLVGYFGKDIDMSEPRTNFTSHTIAASEHTNRRFAISLDNYIDFVPVSVNAGGINFTCVTDWPTDTSRKVKYTISGSLCEFEWKQAADANFNTGNTVTVNFKSDPRLITVDVLENNIRNVRCVLPLSPRHTIDASYDMFCIPYDPNNVATGGVYEGSEHTFHQANNAAAMAVATAIASRYGGYFYDLQLLPYCPIQEFLRKRSTSTGNQYYPDKSLVTEAEVTYCDVTSSGGLYETTVWFCRTSKIDIDIVHTISMPSTVLDAKVAIGTKIWRLNSPNWSAMYEFSPYKNDGVSYFNVKATYKPTSPFIKVYPNYKGLYVDPYTDGRGLVVQGDFSVSFTKDQYESYATQNKYFQQIFNRQIANMETNNKIAREEAHMQSIVGTVQGAATGGYAGYKIGGGAGTAIGAGAGAVASGIAGAADIINLQKRQAEAIDFAKDNFNYSLKTMQAAPDTLSGIGAMTPANTVFPTLEEYGCTSVEENAFKDKLRYNGCVINVIGNIADYDTRLEQNTPAYVKGQFIRLENMGTEMNELAELASEFQKGWFI